MGLNLCNFFTNFSNVFIFVKNLKQAAAAGLFCTIKYVLASRKRRRASYFRSFAISSSLLLIVGSLIASLSAQMKVALSWLMHGTSSQRHWIYSFFFFLRLTKCPIGSAIISENISRLKRAFTLKNAKIMCREKRSCRSTNVIIVCQALAAVKT